VIFRPGSGALCRCWAGSGPYQRGWLRTDIIAGITLAALAIPETMGYTKIARDAGGHLPGDLRAPAGDAAVGGVGRLSALLAGLLWLARLARLGLWPTSSRGRCWSAA
jgi:hypothetical protein